MIVITLALTAGPLCGDTIEPPPTPAQEQPEVLTRGPVHEAFAEPVDLQLQAGVVAPVEPPATIVETPSADKPAGGQFVWIPGYWSWDSERNGYIWVSGCWRAAPSNMYWVPGYWAKVSDGWQWVAGFWSPVTNPQQIEYLPAPPALTDVQPPDNPPSPDVIWVPPCWYWNTDQYIWRPGYWLPGRTDWVWVPSHYLWSPRGYIFARGYWDYPLEQRGVLFAPVYFPTPIYERPGFTFSSSIAIDIGMFQFSLFTYPRYCHYYFGDYFDDSYIGIGIYPWFECEQRHTWYDPFYEHDRWRFHRTDPRWEENQRAEYDHRRADKDLRPPRTYHEMETRLAKLPEPQRRNFQIAEPMNRFVADKKTSMKFEHISNDARNKLAAKTADVHAFSGKRSQWESQPAGQKTNQPLVEHKGAVTQPTGHKEAVSPPVEHKESISQPTGHKEAIPQPTGRKEAVSPPVEHKESISQPAEHKPVVSPPREVTAKKAEQVTIPKSPISNKSGIFSKGPPSRPSDEQKVDVRDTHNSADMRKDSGTQRGADTQRDSGGDRGNRNRKD